MSKGIKVLHIEDNDSDALLITKFLEKNGFNLDYTRVDNGDDFRVALTGEEWDLIISDYRLQGMNGMDVFEIVKECSMDIPFIIVSGQIGEERAVEAMRAGVKDYISKDNMARLIPAIKRELEELDNRKKHKAVESLLQKTKKEFELQRQREHEMKLMGQLVSGVAHEVRNPLNAITALFEAMFQDDLSDTENLETYKKYINVQVERLKRLTKDLLEFGKPNNKSDFSEIDIVKLCSATVEFWNKSLTSDGRIIVFENQIEEEKNLEICADYSRLQQVFINLFENASIHSPPDTEIKLILNFIGGTISIKIVDQGCGIKEEVLERVFEPFFTTRKAGTGLGLGIVRTILSAHNGTIQLENNKDGKGCTAHIMLPVKTYSTSADESNEDDFTEPSEFAQLAPIEE